MWSDESEEQRVSSVAVLDGGEGGFWLTGHTDGDAPTVQLEPVPPSTVWRRIEDLMPTPSEGNG